jgi:hypothetical protein
LYSVDPAGGAITEIGRTDSAHSTCSGSSTAATADNRTFTVYWGPYCALARLGECISPNGQWQALYSAKGRHDGSGTIVTHPVGSPSQTSFVIDGFVNAAKGIRWAPDSSRFIFYVDNDFFVAVPGVDGHQAVGSGNILSWSPDSSMLLMERVNEIAILRLDGSPIELLIKGRLVSSTQCPVWRVGP